MPRFPRLRDATRYALSMRVLVTGLVVFAAMCTTGFLDAVASALVVGVAVAASSHACEVVLAIAFMHLVKGRIVYGQLDYPFWRTLTACFSAYLVLSCLAALAAAGIASVNPEGGCLLFLVAFPIVIVWWWYSLGRAVAVCGDMSTGGVGAVSSSRVSPRVAATGRIRSATVRTRPSI